MGFPVFLFVVFLIVVSIDTFVMLKKKPNNDEILIEVNTGRKAAEIFNLIAAPLVTLLNAWVFIHSFARVKPILYPQYMDKWYQIFDHRLLESIKEGFLEKRMISDFLAVSRFADSGILNLIAAVLWMIISCIYIYDFYQKKGIYDKGVYLGRSSLYKWDKVCGHEWREKYKKKDKEYIQLVLYVKRNKINKWILGDEPSEIKMTIDMEAYENAVGVLKEKIIIPQKEVAM